jgi:tetratricopeptide (TPR) repeat protein
MAALLLLGGAVPGSAQELALQRSLPPAERAVCTAPEGAPPRPGAERVEEGGRLGSAAQEAALLGELERARQLLDRATRLDPGAPQLAYHHARILEGLGRTEEAFAEYCRYLALVPPSAEAEATARHAAELAPLRPPLPAGAASAFEDGIRAFDAGRYTEADSAFAATIAAAPTWAAPYYNRALARLARGDRGGAAEDLDHYGTLAPEADDALPLRTLLLAPAPRRRFSPALAFSGGVLVPGLGQLYTHRPAISLLTLAGTGGALYLAFQRRSASESPAPNRPYLAAGIGAAAALTLFAAIEACVYAAQEHPPQPASSAAASMGPPLPPPAPLPGEARTPLFSIRIAVH